MKNLLPSQLDLSHEFMRIQEDNSKGTIMDHRSVDAGIRLASDCKINGMTVPTFVVIAGAIFTKESWEKEKHISILFWSDDEIPPEEEGYFCLVVLGDHRSSERTLELNNEDLLALVAGKTLEGFGEQLFSLLLTHEEHERYLSQLARAEGFWAIALVGDGNPIVIIINGQTNEIQSVEHDTIAFT